MAHIALFGGSFNPPHLGHVLCATYARVMTDVDEVWILPVAEHPYAKDLAPWTQRWHMCELAFAHVNGVHLRDDELTNPGGRSFTLVRTLQSSYPDHRFSLIGGSDTRDDVPHWYRGQELAERIGVIAIPRRGYDEVIGALPAISSTLVRDRIRQGESIIDLVPPAVAQFIEQQQLFTH